MAFRFMKCKTVYLVVNPRSGQNFAKLTDILAVFSAAGWKTDVAVREFGGHTMKLATEGAESGHDLVIGYGGDGTLTQVVNGVMAAKGRRGIVGVIPGGTANVWARQIGLPEDPVKAALGLVNSEGRRIDVGHVELESIAISPGTNDRQKKVRPGGRHHFLLMAGLGTDAAILRRVSTSLKEKIGTAAVAVAAVKELPSRHAFPIEVRTSGGGTEAVLWKGQALQVVIGNTRRYGNIVDLTPDAYIDDGVLDLCVITAGSPLTTMQQILSFLLHRTPGNGEFEYFQGGRFWISVPASVEMQLDGSPVKLKDSLSASARAALRQAADRDAVMVTYRFDAMPRALRVAIPYTYDDALFEDGPSEEKALALEHRPPGEDAARAGARGYRQEQHLAAEQIGALLESGRRVTVVGAGPNPARAGTYIVAGGTSKKSTDEIRPVAVRVDDATILVRRTGEPLPPAFAAELPEGSEIVVEGKQSKRGVIRAKRVVVVS
jgi:YegS/Rv2252/BmrU family lipid kinase